MIRDLPEAEQRAAVVREARTWLRTPYHHHARLKGVGVDCAQLPIAVYTGLGFFADVQPDYAPDWHLHQGEELYLKPVLERATRIERTLARAGDFALWRWGRTFSHGGILVTDRDVVHAVVDIGVTLDAIDQHGELSTRPALFFTLWP